MNDKEIANSSTLSIKGYSTNRIKNSSRFSPLSICKKSAEKIAGIHKPVHSSSTNSSNDPSPIKNNNNNNNKKFSNSNNHTPRIVKCTTEKFAALEARFSSSNISESFDLSRSPNKTNNFSSKQHQNLNSIMPTTTSNNQNNNASKSNPNNELNPAAAPQTQVYQLVSREYGASPTHHIMVTHQNSSHSHHHSSSPTGTLTSISSHPSTPNAQNMILKQLSAEQIRNLPPGTLPQQHQNQQNQNTHKSPSNSGNEIVILAADTEKNSNNNNTVISEKYKRNATPNSSTNNLANNSGQSVKRRRKNNQQSKSLQAAAAENIESQQNNDQNNDFSENNNTETLTMSGKNVNTPGNSKREKARQERRERERQQQQHQQSQINQSQQLQQPTNNNQLDYSNMDLPSSSRRLDPPVFDMPNESRIPIISENNSNLNQNNSTNLNTKQPKDQTKITDYYKTPSYQVVKPIPTKPSGAQDWSGSNSSHHHNQQQQQQHEKSPPKISNARYILPGNEQHQYRQPTIKPNETRSIACQTEMTAQTIQTLIHQNSELDEVKNSLEEHRILGLRHREILLKNDVEKKRLLESLKTALIAQAKIDRTQARDKVGRNRIRLGYFWGFGMIDEKSVF